MRVSDKGLAFIAAHEGFVARAYLDAAGVLTVGYGFTMRSRLFAGWWRARHGRGLKPGDTLSREEANRLLLTLLDEEYAPPVARLLKGLSQAAFDACVSVVYNLGPRALGWKWARALKTGDIDLAARLLAKTGTTAGGRRLAGLVRRRRDEAGLLLSGSYGPAAGRAGTGLPDPDLKDTQQDLTRLGYDPGPPDGIIGPRTRKAVLRFQRDNPPLAIDGVAGPATRATLRRLLEQKTGSRTAAAAGMVSAVASRTAGFDWAAAMWSAVALVCAVLFVSLLWRHRGRISASCPELKRAVWAGLPAALSSGSPDT